MGNIYVIQSKIKGGTTWGFDAEKDDDLVPFIRVYETLEEAEKARKYGECFYDRRVVTLPEFDSREGDL